MQLSVGIQDPLFGAVASAHTPTPVLQTSPCSSSDLSLGQTLLDSEDECRFYGLIRFSLGKGLFPYDFSNQTLQDSLQQSSSFWIFSQTHQNNFAKNKRIIKEPPITLPSFSNSESPLVQAEENRMEKEMNHHGMAN